MPVLVQCPDCRTTLRTKPDRLGRRGQCPDCGLVFLLASPVGERLVDDEPDSPELIEELPVLPTEPEPTPRPRRKRPARRAREDRPRGAPWILVAALAFGFLVVCSVAVFLATGSNRPNDPIDQGFALFPPKSEDKPREAVVPPPAPAPAPIRRGRASTVNLDGPVAGLYASGGGRYVVFHLSGPPRLVVYDVPAEKVVGTVAGIESNVQVAVGRSKVFVGNWRDGRITRYDLRGATQEAATNPPPGERITQLAIGAGSDGPLVSGASTTEKSYRARLYDGETLAPIEAAIDDPAQPGEQRRFPLTRSVGASHIGASADGRVISLGDRFYARTATGYRAVPINPSSGLLPSPDGTVLLGNSLVGDDGKAFRFADREPRWLLPATDGPFFLSLEYGQSHPLRLLLHADQDPKPLGELPVAEEMLNWFASGDGNPVSLHRHLVFLPEPGLVVFAARNSRLARILPVDLPALLSKAGRDVTFTSVPPVAVPKNGRYSYAATAVTKDGARPTYRVEAGPPGLSVAADGALAWSPGGLYPDATADVRLAATTPDGKKAVQQFRLFLPDR